MAIRTRWAQAIAQVAAFVGVLALAAPAAAAPAIDLFYQRALMSAVGGDCRLFAPDVATALAAAKAQARGAALRSGADPAALAALEQRAESAAQTAVCNAPSVAAAAQSVRQAFDGYLHLDKMDFPGELAGWTAERPAPSAMAQWRVVQRDRFGWDTMLFGVAGHGYGRPLMAVASFADGAQPYGARLVMRDPTLTSGPYLDIRQADLAGRLPIDARLPPREQTRVFTAEAISPAGTDLRSKDMVAGWAIRFPAAAEAALAGLDPRESVAVEFLFAGDDGESVRTAYVEVGDFAAADAFQAVAQR